MATKKQSKKQQPMRDRIIKALKQEAPKGWRDKIMAEWDDLDHEEKDCPWRQEQGKCAHDWGYMELHPWCWYRDTLHDVVIGPGPVGLNEREACAVGNLNFKDAGPLTKEDLDYTHERGRFTEALDTLIRDGTVGYSYVFNEDGGCVGRDYFVWLKTPENAEWTKSIEDADLECAKMLYNPHFHIGEVTSGEYVAAAAKGAK